MTPSETARLRQVFYERQLPRGYKRPGYAGLVPGRFGGAGAASLYAAPFETVQGLEVHVPKSLETPREDA